MICKVSGCGGCIFFFAKGYTLHRKLKHIKDARASNCRYRPEEIYESMYHNLIKHEVVEVF